MDPHTFLCAADQYGYDECVHNTPEYTEFASCSIDRATAIIVDFIVAIALLYFIATCVLLLSKLRSYRKQPYTSVQVGLVYNTLQVLCNACFAFC